MSIYSASHTHRTTSGAPQVVAAGFAALVFFTFLLPIARVSFAGRTDAPLLAQILHAGSTFNVFALLLMLAPAAGIAAAMLTGTTWRVISALVALIAIALIPLTLTMLKHATFGTRAGLASISPGLGSYILLVGYVLLALTTAVAAIRRRH